MNSHAVVNNQSDNINLEAVSVERGNKPFEMMRVGIKNLSEKVMELFESGVPINMLKGVSEFIAQHKRGAVLVGSSAIAMLSATSADAVLLVNNGNFSDAIGGSIIRSSGITNAIRTADSFTVTGNGDTNLVRYQLAGTSLSANGGQRDISLNNFFVCLYGPNDRWNTPILERQVTPDSGYTNSIGTTVNGNTVHALNFNLLPIQGLQNLAPGSYRIAIFSTAGGNQNAGDFFRLTSAQGVGTVGNSFYDGVGIPNWTSTTTGGGVYANSAVNAQLEAVPEPGSIAALTLGCAALLRRRQRNSN